MKLLITGTTGGIGSAVEAAARAAGHDVIPFNRADFAALAAGKANIHDSLDGIVFATGTCPVASMTRTSDEMLAETFRVNCGLFLALVRHIVKGRLYSPGGMRIVAISSISAREGWAGGAAYCASKGALSALCRAMNTELAPRKISVEAIEPHHVKTRMFDECAGRMGADPAGAIAPTTVAAEILQLLSTTAETKNML